MIGTLTESGTNALFSNPPNTTFIVHHRTSGARWAELGRAATMQGALVFVKGRGKFWIEERNAEGAKDRE